ncbi:type II/IV secretion system protein [Candidatus Parcubacteria bacterium]|nr:type II/IV secretion system protein [Candidatus Parcubacteria bacterium]
MEITKENLKKILVDPGYLSEYDFKRAVKRAQSGKKKIIDLILDDGLIKDEQFGQLAAQNIGYPFVNLREEKFDEKIFYSIPDLVAKSRKLIAFAGDENQIKVGMEDPGDLEMIHVLEKKFSKTIKPYYITTRDLNHALLRYRAGLKEDMEDVLRRIKNIKEDQEKKDELMVKIVDLFLEYGYISKASDIHIEPGRADVIIRFRVDGVMHRVLVLPKKFLDLILSRIKIMAKMRIDEHKAAQDGKFQFKYQDNYIDARVSIVPVNEGENIVIRLLAAASREVNLDESGLSNENLKSVKSIIKNPHGMILVTGPTGCGKTTTIYEILKILNTSKVNIAAIEDPVEYDIEGISQIQINPKTGLTFAKGLRALVRQDPDIIMVGEIRDQETAKIAVNSAMTGHLVLSTLHANDSATTLPRLLDMGIEPYLIVSTIKIIIAQRLVRKLCEKCRYSYKLSQKEAEIINKNEKFKEIIFKKHKKDLNKLYLYKSKGCKVCSDSGYKGRVGIFEVMEMNEAVKEKVLKRASSAEIEKIAERMGMPTIFEDGIDKVLNGVTTLDEVFRVIGEG